MTRSLTPVSIEDIRTRAGRVPRIPLALTPTPLEEAPRLAAELGIGRLFIKRDDLTGLAFGGNKTRNLEFRMAEAVAHQTDVFIAGLEAQSNSARQTTAAANRLGMQTILILHSDRDWHWQGNLLVDRLLGADVRFVQGDSAELNRVLRATADEVRANGRRPYVMNHAGAFALGSALAYLLCTLEIVEQLGALGLDPTDLYMTSLSAPRTVTRLTHDGDDGWITPEFGWDPSGQCLVWTENRFPDGYRYQFPEGPTGWLAQLQDLVANPPSPTNIIDINQNGVGVAPLPVEQRTRVGSFDGSTCRL